MLYFWFGRGAGRWTRGLHKKTSDQIAEQHLRSLGQSLDPTFRNKGHMFPGAGGEGGGDGGGGREVLKPIKSILRPFELFQSQESMAQALHQCKMSMHHECKMSHAR